jgi:hypothetical protein
VGLGGVGWGRVGWGGDELDETYVPQLTPLHAAIVRDYGPGRFRWPFYRSLLLASAGSI